MKPDSTSTTAEDPVVVVSSIAGLVAISGTDELLPVPKSVWPRPLVGDRVIVGEQGDRIVDVAPRRNVLRRADPAGGEQLLAANVDVVAIVCGLDRPLKAGRVQRAAALAWDCEATPVLVLSKADLAANPEVLESQASLENPGVETFIVSVATQTGISELQQRLANQTAVLLGESGSGKSTLTNALLGRDAAQVGRVRDGDHKGRHTTTARQLFDLPTGGHLIDTPGVRAIGLPADLELTDHQFGDILELASACRFRDCTHTNEPHCAVIDAVDTGALAAVRLDQYLRLIADLASAERRSNVHAQREFERKRTKQIYRPAQALSREQQ